MSLDFDTVFFASEARLISQNLPLLKYRQDIISHLLSNQCLILQADTGLGKTTQIPQYLFLHEYFSGYQIFCTQPRKLAAFCVAKRVNEEFRCSNITSSCVSYKGLKEMKETPIVYFSEYMFLSYLLTEIYNEYPLKTCRALIIDEVHERNVETDMILSLVKKYVLAKRPDFKLIVTSATLQEEIFSKYLECSVMTCTGSAYPVKEIFLKNYENYLAETVNVTSRIIQGKIAAGADNETILVFLAGFDEINRAKYLLQKKVNSSEVEILLLYGHLDFKDQQEIINKQSKRIRVVLSTNIAESSLTVPGVTCVVDAGREKTVVNANYKDFRVKFITKMSAIQRKGRAGRTCPGTCYRIYSGSEYEEMEPFREASILHSNLGLLSLKLLKYGIFDMESMPLLDSPDPVAINATYEELCSLKMIDFSEFNTIKLTEIGRFALDLDVSPMLSKFIYHSYKDFECGDEATMLTAMLLCVDFTFLRKENIDEQTDLREKYLFAPALVELGDLVGCLFIFRQYYALLCQSCIDDLRDCTCRAKRKSWSHKFSVCETKLKSALRTYKELISRLETKFTDHVFYFSEEEWAEEIKLAELSLSNFDSKEFLDLLTSISEKYAEFYDKYFESAIISSFYLNLAQYRGDNIIDAGYLYLATSEILVPHPCSQLSKLQFSNPPQYVMFYELSVTSNLFMKQISPVSIEKVKKICKNYLEKINFHEDFEVLSGLIFQNIGPAYMKELLGNTGSKLYDLESDLKSQGAYGLLILPDLMKNTLKIRLPIPYRKLGENLLRTVLDYKRKEVLRKNIVHIPYSKSMVLVMSPGALISEIIYNEETLVYKITDLRNYQSYTEALLDMQNTFEFYQFNLMRKNGEIAGILYFKSQSQVEEALENLRQRPLAGKNGPVFTMRAVEKNETQPCLKMSVGLHPSQLRTMLEYYGEIQYFNVKVLENTTFVYIRYSTSASTDMCLSHFTSWVQEDYGLTTNIYKLQEGILVPKELLRTCRNFQQSIEMINEYLEKISIQLNCDLQLSGNKTLRIYGDLKRMTTEGQELLSDLVNYDTVPVSLEVMRCLEKTFFPSNSEQITWEVWQQERVVKCVYLYYRSALAIYGIPEFRQAALHDLQSLLSVLLKQIYTVELSYKTLKDFRKIELFRKQHALPLQVEISINRRKGSFTISGLKYFVNATLEKLKFQQNFNLPEDNCEICLEDFSDLPVCLSLCGHRFHSQCLNLQIQNCMNESGLGGFPIVCVICSHPLTHNDFCKVLSYSELLSLYSSSLIHFLSQNPTFSHCENANCDFVYHTEKSKLNGNTRKCQRCNGNYCILCKKQVLGIGHEIRCEIENLKKYSAEDAKWVESNTTPCPRCFIRIEKNKGCNHVVCSRCACHFCFICKEEITHVSAVDHYKQPEKPCYMKYMVN